MKLLGNVSRIFLANISLFNKQRENKECLFMYF